MLIKIEKLIIRDTDKDGKPLINKQGKPYKRLSVFSDGRWYSGFHGKWSEGFAEGMEVDVEISEAVWSGKTFYNIKEISLETKLQDVLKKMESLEKRISVLESGGNQADQVEMCDLADIPF